MESYASQLEEAKGVLANSKADYFSNWKEASQEQLSKAQDNYNQVLSNARDESTKATQGFVGCQAVTKAALGASKAFPETTSAISKSIGSAVQKVTNASGNVTNTQTGTGSTEASGGETAAGDPDAAPLQQPGSLSTTTSAAATEDTVAEGAAEGGADLAVDTTASALAPVLGPLGAFVELGVAAFTIGKIIDGALKSRKATKPTEQTQIPVQPATPGLVQSQFTTALPSADHSNETQVSGSAAF